MKDNTCIGIIDIGTYSIKLVIAEKAQDDIRKLESLKNVIPLGRDTFFKDHISHETINRTVSILKKYSEKLKEYDVDDIKVIATTAVREAENRDIFIDTIFRKTGFKVEVLTVGDVIYYVDSYLYHRLKDTYPLHDKNILIAELGSGNIDVSVLDHGYTLMNVGLPLGTLRLNQFMNKLDGSVAENSEAVAENIENEFSYLMSSLPSVEIDDIILIDEGYASYLPAMLPGRRLQGKFFSLSKEDTQQLLDTLLEKSASDIAAEYKIPAETAGTFLEYAIILNTFAGLGKKKQVYMLEASLSEAILSNLILDYEKSLQYNKTNQLLSIAKALCIKFDMDMKHVEHVSKLSATLFDNFKGMLGLEEQDRLYLLLAAYLHDIGRFIYNRAHHKHTEYIISNLNLFRLSPDEIKVIACIGRYHRRGTPAATHPVYSSLPQDKQILVQKLSAILRIANALDRCHKQKVKKIEVKFSISQDITITVHVSGNFINEKLDFMEKKEIFEEISGSKIDLKIRYA